MKLDKKTLDMLSSLPDESLWKMICAIGSASGIDLSSVKVRPGELDRLRQAVSTLTDDDIGRAREIMDTCKKHES